MIEMNFETVGIPGKVLKIIPVSGYQETIYTQDVFVEFINGKKAAIEDSSMLISDKMINKDLSLKIQVDCENKIIPNLEHKKGINPIEPIQNNYQGPYADLCGVITEKYCNCVKEQNPRHNVIIDVGIGTVYAEIPEVENIKKMSINEGDFIHIHHASIHLFDVVILNP